MSELFPRSTPRRRASREGFNEREPKPKSEGSLFVWTIFILLLVALVAVCWMGTLYIFGHPELPMGYSVLTKFKKLEAPKRFSEIASPKGEFLDAKKLLARYNTMTPRQLQKESDRLLRGYIRNYQNFDGLVPYITGNYTLLDSYELTKDDFFQSGVVAIAQDTEVPNVLLENIYPTDAKVVPGLYRSLLTGLDIQIHRSLDLSPVIHIERLPDGRLKFTTIPIQYPSYSTTQGGAITLEPPATLNVEAGLPVLNTKKVTDADQHYASFRRKQGKPDTTSPAPSNALMAVRPAVTSDGRTPEPPVRPAAPVTPSTPPPSAGPITEMPPAATPEPTVMPAIAVNGSNPPAQQATPAPAVTTPTAVGTDVPLKPFLGTQATVASTTNGKWTTYKPGQMPRGRLVGVSDARSLASADVSNQPMYLQGDFTVTAAAGTRSVLRASTSDPTGAATTSNTRVIVQYPSGKRPPEQGDQVNRGSDRPFLITDIRRTPDGQVNIYVREVTSE
jgi:hypothetical protein